MDLGSKLVLNNWALDTATDILTQGHVCHRSIVNVLVQKEIYLFYFALSKVWESSGNHNNA